MPDRDPIIESLKERAWQEVAAIDQALAERRITEDEWHEAGAALIKSAYLAADNPYGQAGHSGDAATWESSRGFIAEAIHRSGTFLDVGCASGILMESVHRWGAIKKLNIESHGLDIIAEFVQLARRRLPHWADRIYVGNIRTWRPMNDRFDFVLIRPEYAPASRRADLVRHVMDHVLKPDGRLIVFVGAEETDLRSVESSIATQGFTVNGRVETPHPKDSRVVRRLFWIDASRLKNPKGQFRSCQDGVEDERFVRNAKVVGIGNKCMKPEMTAAALIDLLHLFESAGIDIWLDGGWAVDAVLGEQTRPHKDVDVILRVSDLSKLRDILGAKGFEIQHGGTESNFVLADRSGIEVDVHAITFDQDGNGMYRMENGSDWIFPAAGFSGRGIIQGVDVRCLTPEVQVLCHAHGYVPTEKDFRDMELLQSRFGVELPPHLRRTKG